MKLHIIIILVAFLGIAIGQGQSLAKEGLPLVRTNLVPISFTTFFVLPKKSHCFASQTTKVVLCHFYYIKFKFQNLFFNLFKFKYDKSPSTLTTTLKSHKKCKTKYIGHIRRLNTTEFTPSILHPKYFPYRIGQTVM